MRDGTTITASATAAITILTPNITRPRLALGRSFDDIDAQFGSDCFWDIAADRTGTFRLCRDSASDLRTENRSHVSARHVRDVRKERACRLRSGRRGGVRT